MYHIRGWGKFNRHYGDFCTGADIWNSLYPVGLMPFRRNGTEPHIHRGVRVHDNALFLATNAGNDEHLIFGFGKSLPGYVDPASESEQTAARSLQLQEARKRVEKAAY